MNNQQFEALLQKHNLTKTQFAELVGMTRIGVSKWVKTDNIPTWVEPFFVAYGKSLAFDELQEALNTIKRISGS